jgi:tetratricopeptide (TPR) repeat protein
MDNEDGRKIKIFCSYSHKDANLRVEITKQINKEHSIWHDRKIMPGQNWAKEIDSNLDTADVILLLISPDFKASEYCSSIEMGRALEREKKKEACIIPILLRPVDWVDAPFLHCQRLPEGPKAVTQWGNRDAAFANIAQGLRKVIEKRRLEISSAGFMEEDYASVYFSIALDNINSMLFFYDKAIRSASEDSIRKVHLIRNKGTRLYDLGKSKEALLVYNTVISLINDTFGNKFCAYVYKERGDIFRYLNLFAEALEDYEMAIHFLPSFAEAIKWRDKILEDRDL